MNAEKRFEIFKRLSAAIPNPTTELKHSSTFELLIAVILSAQATDKGVNLATNKLFAIANTPETILALGLEGLEHYIKTIGLYHAKAKNVLGTCQMLITHHQSQVPNTRVALEALPGVGRKTANVILNTAFGEPTIAVDTHLFRLGNRTKLATGKTVLEVEKKYIKTIPVAFIKDYTCIARKPKCAECCIEDLCEYQAKEYNAPNLPNKSKP
jgi:endonuclease-3